MLNIAVFGSGSGTNCQSLIDAIAAGKLNAQIKVVIADREDAKILERARKHNIPALFLDCAPFKSKLDEEAQECAIQILRDHAVDTIALAGFMRVIKPGLLEAFPNRVFNIHPALLPAFPGLHAWKQAISSGAKIAGCTVHFVDAGIDSGPIINQKAVPVLDDDTPETLHARIQEQEHIAYPEALQWLAEDRIEIAGRRVLIRDLHS
jgi:phosphoribosylglycinamide formyltransferase-1